MAKRKWRNIVLYRDGEGECKDSLGRTKRQIKGSCEIQKECVCVEVYRVRGRSLALCEFFGGGLVLLPRDHKEGRNLRA